VRPDLIDHIVIYGSDACPVCAGLWDQRDRYRSLAGCPVEFRKAVDANDSELAAGTYPAAAGIGADGTVVSGPVWGLTQIRDLLRVTSTPARAS
jgi:hypothetical protein